MQRSEQSQSNVLPIALIAGAVLASFSVWRVLLNKNSGAPIVTPKVERPSTGNLFASPPPPRPETTSDDWAYMVARIDAGGDVDKGGPEVRRVRKALDERSGDGSIPWGHPS